MEEEPGELVHRLTKVEHNLANKRLEARDSISYTKWRNHYKSVEEGHTCS